MPCEETHTPWWDKISALPSNKSLRWLFKQKIYVASHCFQEQATDVKKNSVTNPIYKSCEHVSIRFKTTILFHICGGSKFHQLKKRLATAKMLKSILPAPEKGWGNVGEEYVLYGFFTHSEDDLNMKKGQLEWKRKTRTMPASFRQTLLIAPYKHQPFWVVPIPLYSCQFPRDPNAHISLLVSSKSGEGTELYGQGRLGSVCPSQ